VTWAPSRLPIETRRIATPLHCPLSINIIAAERCRPRGGNLNDAERPGKPVMCVCALLFQSLSRPAERDMFASVIAFIASD
jgi:hypothetical protein